jgi:plastocyanin
MAGFAFEPSSVSVPEGDSLTLRNEDTAAHTFTMDDGSLDVSLEPGQQVEVTPEAGGAFHCEIHPAMTGTLTLG